MLWFLFPPMRLFYLNLCFSRRMTRSKSSDCYPGIAGSNFSNVKSFCTQKKFLNTPTLSKGSWPVTTVF